MRVVRVRSLGESLASIAGRLGRWRSRAPALTRPSATLSRVGRGRIVGGRRIGRPSPGLWPPSPGSGEGESSLADGTADPHPASGHPLPARARENPWRPTRGQTLTRPSATLSRLGRGRILGGRRVGRPSPGLRPPSPGSGEGESLAADAWADPHPAFGHPLPARARENPWRPTRGQTLTRPLATLSRLGRGRIVPGRRVGSPSPRLWPPSPGSGEGESLAADAWADPHPAFGHPLPARARGAGARTAGRSPAHSV